MKLHWIFDRYMRPADDGDTGGAGGAVDRGDNWTPTDDAGTDDNGDDNGDDKGDDKGDDDGTGDDKGDDDGTGDDEGDDGTGDDEGDDKGDSKSKKGRKDARIPLNRHKAILEREREQRRAVEQELARYRQGQEIADTNKEITAAEDALLALEKQHAELVVDGKATEAAELMNKIRKAERGIIEKRSEMNLAAVQARAVEQVRYETTLERLEDAYPQINPDHEDFDRAKMSEVLELKEAFQSRGEPPSKALQKAVKYVFPATTGAQKRATETEARVDKDAAAEAVAKARKAGAVKKNTDAASKQPPSTSKVGMDHDKAGHGGPLTAAVIMKMSHEQFSKLSEADLARARGDDF